MQAISLYWFAAQQQTSTLGWQKIGFFNVKFSTEFDDKLSIFFLKATGSGQKMTTKTEVVRMNANWRRSEPKG